MLGMAGNLKEEKNKRSKIEAGAGSAKRVEKLDL